MAEQDVTDVHEAVGLERGLVSIGKAIAVASIELYSLGCGLDDDVADVSFPCG